MPLVWHLLEATLGDESPSVFELGLPGVRALVVSVRDPKNPACWRAMEHGEQKTQGGGFHAEYDHAPGGDRVSVFFDGGLRAEPVRIAFAVEG